MSTKYLDSTGLAYFWDKIKDYVDSHGGDGGTPTVYNAPWTATSSSGGSVQVTGDITLPPGIYIAILKVPICSQTSGLSFALSNVGNWQGAGQFATGQDTNAFIFTLTSTAAVHALTQMSASTNYTYIDRGWLRAVRIGSIDGESSGIVETGTSGIWKYRKWADGTAECWGRTAAKNYAVTSAYVNGWYANLDQVTFPSGLFVDAPIVNATRAETGSGAALLFPSLHTVTSTGFKGFIGSVSSGTYSVSLSIMAKGRWK